MAAQMDPSIQQAIGSFLSENPLLTGLIGVLLFFGKDLWKRVTGVERRDNRQDVAFAGAESKFEERFKTYDARVQGLSDRITQVEAHVNQIADIRADIRGLQTEVKAMASNIQTIASMFERAMRKTG